MLRVRIDSHETKVTPASLAQMVFDGKVDRHNLARSSDGATQRPLERAMEAPYLDLLTEELLARLQSMYRRGGPVEDIDLLRTRVESLCQWYCEQPNVRARFLWGAAWLNELTDRPETAVGYYDAFLQTRCHEPDLRLLAYNNRGVLCIRLGRLDGVQDLARSAIPLEPGATGPESAVGLPAACFNLLNLIDVALEVDSLRAAVDEELTEYVGQLSEDARLFWLGAELIQQDADAASLPAGTASRPGPRQATPHEWSLLSDPTYRCLNRLTTNLAARARLLDGPQTVNDADDQQPPCRLLLWGHRRPSALRGEGSGRERDEDLCRTQNRHSDAATLLLSNQIPSSLRSHASPGRRAEQLAQEELAEIESLVVAGNFELARSRLEVQRKVLSGLDHHERAGSLLAQVDSELLRIQTAETEFEQLRLQRACAKLVSELEQLCKLTSLAPAERQMEDLKHKLDEHRAHLAPQAAKELGSLLDELSVRAERHIARLRRLDIRRRIRGSLRQLRARWPADWTTPVPDSAYQALAQCHLNDPANQIEDWPRLREQLDAHQAQHRLRTALAALPSEALSSEALEAVLAEALSLRPDAWRTIAPRFGLTAEPSNDPDSSGRADLRTALEAAASRLLHEPSSNPRGDGVDCRCDLLQRAGSLLDQAFQRLHGDPRRFLHLWNCVQGTLEPALTDATVDAVGAMEEIAGKCLGRWPAKKAQMLTRSDPRNPVRLFLETCEKTRCLATAEQLLDADPARAQTAREHIASAIEMGLDSRDQVRRAATCVYLAELCAEDRPRIQRQILNAIDAWAAELTDNAVHRTTEEEIVDRIGALKKQLQHGPKEPAEEAIDSPHDDMDTSDGLPVATDRPGD